MYGKLVILSPFLIPPKNEEREKGKKKYSNRFSTSFLLQKNYLPLSPNKTKVREREGERESERDTKSVT